MRVEVLIPWSGGDEWRTRALGMVLDLYRNELPWEVSLYGYKHDERRPSAALAVARNEAAAASPADLLIFNDADSICDPEHIHQAVTLAAETPGLVFAWDTYHRLSWSTTLGLNEWQDALEAPVEWSLFDSLSAGCMAIRKDCFEQVGGFDPSWATACEDCDFAERCNTIWPNQRVEGDLIHLWHPRPEIEPENTADGKRWVTRAAA